MILKCLPYTWVFEKEGTLTRLLLLTAPAWRRTMIFPVWVVYLREFISFSLSAAPSPLCEEEDRREGLSLEESRSPFEEWHSTLVTTGVSRGQGRERYPY